jgi:anti-sigma-K factor RskA
MSPRESDFDCPQLVDAAAYVLGAPEHDELARYREHIHRCAECRAEVAELQLVVDELPASVPRMQAPESLRERILTSARAEAEVLHAAGHHADRPVRTRRRLRSPGAVLLGAGAAVLAAVAVVLAIALSGSSPVRERISHGVVTASAPGASATLHIRAGHADLIVAHMPEPGRGRIYEVWLLRRGSAEPAPTSALFGVTVAGSGAVDVPGSLGQVKEVLVTSEPLGGSAHPTRKPVIAVAVS